MPQLDEIFRAARANHQAGRLREAESQYQQILAAEPRYAPAWQMLGIMSFQLNRFGAAVDMFRQAAAFGMDVHHNLGEALRALGWLDEAMKEYRISIRLNPGAAAPHGALGAALNELGRCGEAIPHLQKALSIQPYPNGHFQFGVALEHENRLDEAIEQWRKTRELQPDHNHALNAITRALLRHGKRDEANACVDRALKLRPDDAVYRLDCAHILLLLERYREGFAEYECRYRTKLPEVLPPKMNKPAWDGSDPNGHTILVHFEQGFGDAFQFCRYVPMLVDRGAKVILSIIPAMAELLATVSPQVQVIPTGAGLPPFDLHVSAMSFPHLFGTTIDTIPAKIPYLDAPSARLTKWKPILETHARRDSRSLKVGLVWGGRPKPDPKRSIPIQSLAPLSDVPGIAWYSLQTGEPQVQLSDPPAGMNVIDLGKDLADFSDTAAALSHLDLFLTIDTAAAHLAGALGVPTWTMLHSAADWRWTAQGDTTPWYPGMRLFRQSKSGGWDEVVEKIRAELVEKRRQ
jgi:Flp pilus assembly protein TadD